MPKSKERPVRKRARPEERATPRERAASKERATLKERAVITVNGIDHPGIIAAITKALADLDVNIEDLSQTIVQGLFTMILIADITDHDLGQLQDRMARVGRQQGVQITVQHENIFKYMHRV